MKCTADTATGKPCGLRGEHGRNGLCHVHDPNGIYQQQQKARAITKSIYIPCPATTSTGKACSLEGMEDRNGLCHMHDPNGKYQKQHPKYAKAVAKRNAALRT